MAQGKTIWFIFLAFIFTDLTITLLVELPYNTLDIGTGETLKLECIIREAPENTNFYWSFNGMNLDQRSRKDEALGNFDYKSTITVTNVTRADTGPYFCIANNEQEDSHHSDVTTVHVMYAPINNYREQQIVRLLENFPTEVTYDAPGYPEAVIQIYHNQNELLNAYNDENSSLILPFIVEGSLRTFAVNNQGQTELPFTYIVVELITSRSIIVQSATDHFKVKLSTNGVSEKHVYLILAEKFGSERYSKSPIDVNLTPLTSCSTEPNDIVRNIVQDFSTTVSTNEAQDISKPFLSPVNNEALEPDTEYLVWVLKSDTFICPDGKNWAILQPVEASDYQIVKTLPKQETVKVVEQKTNEVLIAIIVAGAVIVLIMIISTIILSARKLCSKSTEEAGEIWRMQKYAPSVPTHQKMHQELFEGQVLETPRRLEQMEVIPYRETSPRFHDLQVVSPRNTPGQENLYSVPDEYHSREAVLGNASNRSDTGSYTAQIAYPVYVDNASSFYTPPVDRSHLSRLGRTGNLPGFMIEPTGLQNPAYHWSKEKILANNYPFISPISEEQGQLNDSITETIEYEMQSFNHSGEIERFRNVLQRSSDSSTLTEHTRSGETYYNTPVIAPKPFKKGANSQRSTLERCPEWIRHNRVRKVSTPTKFKALPESSNYLNFSTNSLPELLWRERSHGRLSEHQSSSGSSSGPRELKSFGGKERSLSANDLTYDPSLKSLNNEVFYLQI